MPADPTWNQLTPAELLERTGQTEPPVKFWPILDRFCLPHRFREGIAAQVEWDMNEFRIVIPKRAHDPAARIAIAHDLRQLQLGVGGRSDDMVHRHLQEQEREYDRWARELLMPAPWFRKDVMRLDPRQSVRELAQTYCVRPHEVIDRGLDLELTHLICRDAPSYRIYQQHPWWQRRRADYFSTHRFCEHVDCTNRSVVCHHVNYKRLGRERDDDLRALCAVHHQANHPHRGQTQLPV
jgi:hypothetical protein